MNRFKDETKESQDKQGLKIKMMSNMRNFDKQQIKKKILQELHETLKPPFSPNNKSILSTT